MEGGETQTHQGLERAMLFPQFVEWPRRNILAMIHGRKTQFAKEGALSLGGVKLSCGGDTWSPRVSKEVLVGPPA